MHIPMTAPKLNAALNSRPAGKWPSVFFKPLIQAKLKINQPGDIYEQQADAMAAKILQMPAYFTKTHFFHPKPVPPSTFQRKCACCKMEETMQAKSATTGGGLTAPPIVSDALLSGGQSLDNGTKEYMEARFGHDFGKVKIHNNALAHRAASEINALAYTYGHHIVFGQGQYHPESASGTRLLAHELTHVTQQSPQVRRAVSYDAKGKEDYSVNPAVNIRDKQYHMGSTRPTMNGKEMDSGTNPLKDPKYSFADGVCSFADVKDTLSYNVKLPFNKEWRTMISVDDAKKMLAPTERDKLKCDLAQIPLIVKGDPDNKQRADQIRNHELGHVRDLKTLYDTVLLPWSNAFTAKIRKGSLATSGQENCLNEFYNGIGSRQEIFKRFVDEFAVLDAAYHRSAAGKTAQPRNQEFSCKRIEFKL